MSTLDVRRHTMRRKPGAHLSREGIALARLVAESSPPYDLVVTSMVPRAIETAIAMGLEVGQYIEGLGHLSEAVNAVLDFPSAFAVVAQAVANHRPVASFAAEQARLWRDVAQQVPEGGRGLIVTHGLFVELGAVASVPDADHAGWGGAIGYCEGVRLFYSGQTTRGELLRVPEQHRLIEN